MAADTPDKSGSEVSGIPETPVLGVLDEGFGTESAYRNVVQQGRGFGGESIPHGTSVARVAANALDTSNLPDLIPQRMEMSLSEGELVDTFAAALENADKLDVATASWGVGKPFGDDFGDPAFAAAKAAIETAVTEGRDGLGTNLVFAAGNARQMGDNVNHHGFQNSTKTIAVGALDEDGQPAAFSTPGASVLVSAGGVNVPLGGDAAEGATTVSGTSFAAPKVSATVARMLEVNPDLGYRDVQEVLAATADPTTVGAAQETSAGERLESEPLAPETAVNDASTWNAGGFAFNERVGFGALDSDAAVRVAKHWEETRTEADLVETSATVSGSHAIPDGGEAVLQVPLHLDGDVRAENVSLDVDIQHNWIGDLSITLVSPGGTRSTLLDRPGREPNESGDFGSFKSDIDFTLTSSAFRGESGEGTWHLEVNDQTAGFEGVLEGAELTVEGSTADNDDTYVFTNAFDDLADQPGRGVLADEGGHDHLLAAALTKDAVIDLRPGATSEIAGGPLDVREDTMIERATGGAGNDKITGNAQANTLVGGSGDDTLRGGPGNDQLVGGTGEDTFVVGEGADKNVVADYDRAEGDRVKIEEEAVGREGVRVTQTDDATRIEVDDGTSVELQGIGVEDVDWFIA